MREMKESRKTRYTRTALQDSLFELMKEKSISQITIKELCENADINRTTFYAHYADQYDLLHKIEDETLAWMQGALDSLIHQTERSEMIKILEGIFQDFIDNNRYLQILISEQGDLDFQKQLFTLIYRQCGLSSSKPLVTGTEPYGKEDYLIFVVNGSIGLIQHWLKDGIKRSAKEMAEIIYTLAAQIGEAPMPRNTDKNTL
ncbi:TetR/AcrR family transcriptional regulator [Faecalispora jeddahensis]|uniref:TetR/AcrR family transcriptional regulator n=1 Tax=Faecalispora jeddahensis TaxID=1414721 RepID=UPI0004B60B0B|nr:TetR-like C-terminal domain-containing protein [Faecalispora jeddahensis]